MATAAARRTKPPSLDETTQRALDQLMIAWSEIAAEAKRDDRLVERLRASRVCDLLLDLRAVVSEAS